MADADLNTPKPESPARDAHLATGKENKTWLLRASYGLFACSVQMWHFSAALVLFSSSNASLFRPALFGLIVVTAPGIFCPVALPLVQNINRFFGSAAAIFVTSVSVITSAVLLAILVKHESIALLVLVFVFSGIAAVGEFVTRDLLTKEWTGAVATSAEETDVLNGNMNKITWWVRILAPIVAGTLLSATSPFTMSIVSGSMFLVSFVMCIFFLRQLHGLTEQAVSIPARTPTPSLADSLSYFAEEKTAFAAIAGSFIYMTHLVFGSVLTSYLKFEGFSYFVVAIFLTCAVVVEFVARSSFPMFQSIFRVVSSGVIAVWLEVFCLALCVASTFFSGNLGLGLLVCGAIFSHFGASIFSLAVGSILKTRVQAEQYEGVTLVQHIIRVALLGTVYGLAVAFSSPQYWYVLVYVSFSAVFFAALVFSFWALSNKNEPASEGATAGAGPSEVTPLLS